MSEPPSTTTRDNDDSSPPDTSMSKTNDPEEEQPDPVNVVHSEKEPAAAEETASSSDEEDPFAEEEDEEDPMPLFKYARLVGSLPRVPKRESSGDGAGGYFSEACSCSAMGKVTTPVTAAATESSLSSGGAGLTPGSSQTLLPKQNYVLAMGFENGLLCLVDAQTGVAIVPSDQLKVKEWPIPATNQRDLRRAIIDVSFDASGNFLGAINASGVCAIWEIKYTISTAASQQDESMFGFFNRPNPATASGGTSSPQTNLGSAATLTSSSATASRISYPSSFGQPTCLALDPAYKRRREKAMLVGFADGRLMLTKRGFVFQRRSDAVIYQGTADSNDYKGIESIAWRGSMVAWADASGIKLYDVDSMARIAHVDRPTGARVSLYPTVLSLRPTMLFETSDSLLVAWGDCVMSMSIQETKSERSRTTPVVDGLDPRRVLAVGGGLAGEALSDLAQSDNNTSDVVKKHHVECSMAWQLDCVACGVVPLDEEHLVVLGLVPHDDDESDVLEDTVAPPHDRVSLGPLGGSSNDLEVHVVSRLHGTITYSDALPLLSNPSHSGLLAGPGTIAESASSYMLLSSYAVPRMDDAIEAEEEGVKLEDEDFDFQVSLFRTPSSETLRRSFEDSHQKWSIQELSFDGDEKQRDEIPVEEKAEEETKEEGDLSPRLGTRIAFETTEKADDDQSVDSDDYTFLFRPFNKVTNEPTSSTEVFPPAMVIVSRSDAVRARTRDIDDAVSHALSAGKRGVALRRGLCYKRQLRRHDLNDLINGYLGALLRHRGDPEHTIPEKDQPGESLSIRRLLHAARAMPILLGGNVRMWVKWVPVFAHIPGALFVLRDHIPVRDPKLPANVYETALEKMFVEVESMLSASPSSLDQEGQTESLYLHQQAKDRFLSGLCAWGPTSALREHIKFYNYQDERLRRKRRSGLSVTHPLLAEAEKSLLRRLHQTAVGFLEFPSTLPPESASSYPEDLSGVPLVDAADSLFDINAMITCFSTRVPFLSASEQRRADVENSAPATINSHVALEAMAELYLMRGMYEMALKCFLMIGSLHTLPDLSVLENAAVAAVNDTVGGDSKTAQKNQEYHPYAHVLAIIEYHQLHRCLLEEDFISSASEETEDTPSEEMDTLPGLLPPMIALIRLVGLDLLGEFLVEHSVPAVRASPGGDKSKSLETEGTSSRDRHSTLPINSVADQFRSSPKLLHWYLHQMSQHKPEIYVKFPNTAVPSIEIRELHRSHLDLYLKYAGGFKDSAQYLSSSKAHSTVDPSTPLISFLKAVLPLGSVRPDDVKRLLEGYRAGKQEDIQAEAVVETGDEVKFPHLYALELAHVMEHYGKGTEEDAKKILSLYLNGCKSLSLAVFYAQRNTAHSELLWEILVDTCLNKNQNDDSETATSKMDGTLFGALLEAAALSGADLAHLVTVIPQGMRIEGLRPKLVAAVADYRWKLQMHEAASEIVTDEKIVLLRELSHRSRRGMRFQKMSEREGVFDGKGDAPQKTQATSPSSEQIQGVSKRQSFKDVATSNLLTNLRPSERNDRLRLSFSLPIR